MTRPMESRTTLRHLDDAIVFVTANPERPEERILKLGTSTAGVTLLGPPTVLRLLLQDALAQLDAIDATTTETEADR